MIKYTLNHTCKIVTAKSISEGREVYVYGKPVFLYIVDSVDNNVTHRLRKILEYGVNITLVTISDLPQYSRNSKLCYLVTTKKSLDRLFSESLEADLVGYYGATSKEVVEKLVRGTKMKVVYGEEDVISFIKKNKWASSEDFMNTATPLVIETPVQKVQVEETNSIRQRHLDNKKRILYCRWDSGIGDLLILSAGLKSLKEAYPEHLIVMGCKKEYSVIFENNPYVDEIVYDKKDICKEEYEHIFDCTRFFEHEHYPQDGYDSGHVDRIELLYRDMLKIRAVDRRPLYYITEEEKEWAKSKLANYSKTNILVGFHISSNAPARNYPIDYFIQLQKYLKGKGITSILLGNPKGQYCEIDYGRLRGDGLINLVGLSLRETAAIINEMNLMVCIDSSLLHLSAALEKKTIALFGNILPKARLQYYDTVDELFSTNKLSIDSCVCNDAIWLNKCLPACKSLTSDGKCGLCMYEHTPQKVFTKILMNLDMLPFKSQKLRPKLSFAMMTHNEEEWIGMCLDRIHEIADEIVVVDDSTDDTRKILRKYSKVKIVNVNKKLPCPDYCDYCRGFNIDLKKIGRPCSAKLRQQSFQACSGDWIFRIDADEIIRREDLKKLRLLVDYSEELFPGIKIFWFAAVNFFLDDCHYKMGKQTHVWYPDYHKRLHRNEERFHKWIGPAHERMVDYGRDGQLKFLDDGREFPFQHFSNWFKIFHYGYLQPKKDRTKDAEKYKAMGVLLHPLDNKNIEPWVWSKPTSVILPKGWGRGVNEYTEGDMG